MVSSPLDVSTGKIRKLHFLLRSRVPLFHLLRHEKPLSDGQADESVRLFSFLGYQAPQNCTGKNVFISYLAHLCPDFQAC